MPVSAPGRDCAAVRRAIPGAEAQAGMTDAEIAAAATIDPGLLLVQCEASVGFPSPRRTISVVTSLALDGAKTGSA